jgi:hypothetical protein
MVVEALFGLAVALAFVVYLVVTLIHPEWF